MREIKYEGRFLRVVKDGHWEFVERTNARAAVVIIAVTDAGEVLLCEQHRIPVAANVIELPAGLVGDTDDADAHDLLACAKRELIEETGFEASDWRQVAYGPISPGLSTEEFGLFVARGLRRVSAGGGIEHERILTTAVPIAELHDWLARKTAAGVKIDPKVYLTLAFAS